MMQNQRGFTLLTSIILSSVILSLGIALLDISYKQTILSSSAKNSQYAFYAADTAMECALYWDNKQGVFNQSTAPATFSIECAGQSISVSEPASSGTRTATFSIPCVTGSGSAPQARATITKSSANATNIYVTGYSSCESNDPRRIERGLKINY